MSGADLLRWGGLEISFQRLGRTGWSPTGLLRSWARAPWRSVEDGVVIACLPGEVVWLGLTAMDAAASVRCESVDGAWWRELAVPPDWQLGWLQRDAATRPIDLGGDARSAGYRLAVTSVSLPDPMRCGLELVSPDEWRRRFGPLDVEPAVEPPPVGRYSRVIPPDEQGRP